MGDRERKVSEGWAGTSPRWSKCPLGYILAPITAWAAVGGNGEKDPCEAGEGSSEVALSVGLTPNWGGMFDAIKAGEDEYPTSVNDCDTR